jgi:periplasmic divalent cation tolerance protein
MPTELIQVITTTAEKTDAQTLANLLLEKRLAGCTQISGPIESSYWWNNRLDTVREWQLVIKTRRELFEQVAAVITEHHPYDEPEILATPILHVSAGYRKWLLEQLSAPLSDLPGEGSLADE